MFKFNISKDLWDQKYRYMNESEDDFYKRIAFNVLPYPKKKKKVPTKRHKKMYELLKDHKVMFAGRILRGVGTDREVTLSNCFVIPIKSDSMKSIMDAASDASLTMKAGGGVGYNFTILRPKNSKIKTSGTKSTGSVEFIKIFDAVCSTVTSGGNRRGAQIGILSIYHPDIYDFIHAKDKGDLTNFNLSVLVDDKFMEAVKNDDDWKLVFPDLNYEKYDEEWTSDKYNGNINKWIEDGKPIKVYKTVKAKSLYHEIIYSNWHHAEPGILFEDNINNNNPLRTVGEYINAVNPCGEQPLPPYSSCNLAMINVAEFVDGVFSREAKFDFEGLHEAVDLMIRGLDHVLDINKYPIPEMKEVVKRKRQIGLGITGLADAFYFLGLKYSSQQARDMAEKIMESIKIQSYLTSIELAKEKGPFLEFDADKYIEAQKDFLPSYILDEIAKYGIRNSRLNTVAPTGTTSLIMNNISSGLEPVFQLEYNRKIIQEDGSEKIEVVRDYAYDLYVEEFGKDDIPDYFETTSDLTWEDHIQMQHVIQKHVDASVSKTINLPKEVTVDEMKDVYIYAHELGLKGCTTYRPNDILGSVLSTTDEESDSDKKKQPEEIIQLSSVEMAERHRIKWKQTKVYVIVSIDENRNPLEIFVKLPREVGYRNKIFDRNLLLEFISNWDTISRQVSLNLRYGIPLQQIIKNLDKSSYSLQDYSAILSRVLKKYVKEEDTGEKCPNCGSTLVMVEGCNKCPSCGWSRCG